MSQSSSELIEAANALIAAGDNLRQIARRPVESTIQRCDDGIARWDRARREYVDACDQSDLLSRAPEREES